MARARGRGVALVALLMGAALTGCTGGEPEQGDPGAPDARQTEEAGGSTAEGEAPDAGGEGDEGAADDEAEASLTVEADGDGPIGLATPDAPDGEAQELSGMLITGPGGCFAVEDGAPPQLVVFAEDAEFVLRDARPSVTTPAIGTVAVGEDFDFTAVEVPLGAVDGVPDECVDGAQETVLVVEE
ncbi:hypothetical protein GCM10009718_34430 [Isoptericola halotolerans]|uniref:Lipoprotein n=1 Tax=Isoptericola halotolerans TaxID=300560 RepID=A0ABX2A363_9MICO|nr:hypothetical protein [Isoptericola halotolerans]NOV97089.1 hypothetical protein [Isoptericola halotolerans]